MRTLATIEVITPLREPLRNMKAIRKNAITDGEIEEVAFLPPIVLIKILCIFPRDIISEISSRSAKLNATVRLPLAMNLLSCGIIHSFAALFFKSFGELITGVRQPGD